MDQNTQNASGMMNGMPPMPKQEKKVGPIVGVLVIVLVLIVAALYFFSSKMETAPIENAQPSGQVESELPAAAAKADDVATLEQELNATFSDVDYSF